MQLKSKLWNRAARRAAATRERRTRPKNARGARDVALRALTASALALPGLGGAAGAASAGETLERWSISTSNSFYREDDIDESSIAPGGSTERMEVSSHFFKIQGPFTERTDVALDFVYERMSGASPWFIQPDANGDPVQVMSGATIEDQRFDVLLKGNYHLDNGRTALTGGISKENDYFSGNFGVEAEVDLMEGNTVIAAGAGASFDTITPTDSELFATRVDEEEKQSYTAFLSGSQILGRSSTLQTSLSFQHSRGFLSDPYKLVSVELEGEGRVNLPDSRPSLRNQLAWLTRFRHHFAGSAATLHADYRFFIDDWGMRSQTVELAWHQTLWERFRIIPLLRYYSQSEADFYELYFDAFPKGGNMSSDYRLSAFGAFSGKITAETVLPEWWFGLDWRAAISYERYMSNGDFAIEKSDIENPGLVSFNLFSFNFGLRF